MTGAIWAFLWLATWLRDVAVVVVICDFWMASDWCLMYGLALITWLSMWHIFGIYFTILTSEILFGGL